jgi:hypothetical protein
MASSGRSAIGDNLEDRILGGDAFEVSQRGVGSHGDVRPRAERPLEVAAKDRRSSVDVYRMKVDNDDAVTRTP